MNSWKIILPTLVIFGAGVITGGLLVGYSDRAARLPPRHRQGVSALQQRRTPNARNNRMPPAARKEFLDRLKRELNLSPQQYQRIEAIIRNEMVATRQRIRSELNPAQQALFQQLLRQRPPVQRRSPQHGRKSTLPRQSKTPRNSDTNR